MQIVIDVSEEDYEKLKDGDATLYRVNRLLCALRDGTPLPKGCGRIVDIDKLIDSKCNECGHVKGVSCTVPCYEVRRMLSAPTVIEAGCRYYANNGEAKFESNDPKCLKDCIKQHETELPQKEEAI